MQNITKRNLLEQITPETYTQIQQAGTFLSIEPDPVGKFTLNCLVDKQSNQELAFALVGNGPDDVRYYRWNQPRPRKFPTRLN